MNHFIYLFVLLEAPLFFAITAILGIPYSGGQNETLYSSYCIIGFFISVLFFLNDYRRMRIKGEHVISIIIIGIYVLSGLIAGYSSDKSWLCLVAFCLPSTLIAIYYASSGKFGEMVKWLDVFLLIISISLFFMTVNLNTAIESGEGYYSQSLSYYGALCFIFNIFLLRYGKSFKRFHIFESRAYRFITFIMLPLYILVILLSGGRGGFVTLTIGSFLFLLSFKGKRRVILTYSVVFVVSAFVVQNLFFDVASSSLQNMLNRNTERVFSYIDEGGINMAETSGRDFVFEKSIQLIKDNPITGYGLFSYKEPFMMNVKQSYPHNLFLEWLLQGGYPFLIGLSFLMILFIRKLYKLIQKISSYYLFIPFVVFPFTQLMYTGSYMEEPFFWFSIIFIFNYRFITKHIKQ